MPILVQRNPTLVNPKWHANIGIEEYNIGKT